MDLKLQITLAGTVGDKLVINSKSNQLQVVRDVALAGQLAPLWRYTRDFKVTQGDRINFTSKFDQRGRCSPEQMERLKGS